MPRGENRPRDIDGNQRDWTPDDIRSRSLPNANGCWIWQGSIGKSGYGSICQNRAHRVSFFVFKPTEWDPDLLVCHSCDVPSCVNPDHLFLGTNKENTHDKIRKGREAKGNPGPEAIRIKIPEEVLFKMADLYREGWSYRSLAAKFDLTVGVVCKNLQAFGVPKVKRGKWLTQSMVDQIRASDRSAKELSVVFKVHENTIRLIRRGKRWGSTVPYP